MIVDLNETLRQLLLAELPYKKGEVAVSFDQPKRDWSTRLNGPALNLFLYDLRENQVLRQHGWEEMGSARGRLSAATLKRSPLRVDLTYLVTAWAADIDDQHNLLSNALLVLFRYPVLPVERLVGRLKNQPFEIQARLAQPDKQPNPAELWSALENELRLGFSYMLTLAFDPWAAEEISLVRTTGLRTGQMAAPDRTGFPHLEEATLSERLAIAGRVWAESTGTRLDGVRVALKGTDRTTTTDRTGRFRLGGLLPGEYTLVAALPDGQPVEKQVVLPAADGDYDLKLES
jgi:hypothetical protein